eukprot:TRINITY_DN20941_c0_g1_i3.p1 TRINITY_DN20941_c0_g1~~TRINITY_DN20941_c0_g1_i3.p1  ORF type:complete len:1136 (+),score=294.13 TRINITY_DN20941_c0_g1_i3:62-3409(+)
MPADALPGVCEGSVEQLLFVSPSSAARRPTRGVGSEADRQASRAPLRAAPLPPTAAALQASRRCSSVFGDVSETGACSASTVPAASVVSQRLAEESRARVAALQGQYAAAVADRDDARDKLAHAADALDELRSANGELQTALREAANGAADLRRQRDEAVDSLASRALVSATSPARSEAAERSLRRMRADVTSLKEELARERASRCATAARLVAAERTVLRLGLSDAVAHQVRAVSPRRGSPQRHSPATSPHSRAAEAAERAATLAGELQTAHEAVTSAEGAALEQAQKAAEMQGSLDALRRDYDQAVEEGAEARSEMQAERDLREAAERRAESAAEESRRAASAMQLARDGESEAERQVAREREERRADARAAEGRLLAAEALLADERRMRIEADAAHDFERARREELEMEVRERAEAAAAEMQRVGGDADAAFVACKAAERERDEERAARQEAQSRLEGVLCELRRSRERDDEQAQQLQTEREANQRQSAEREGAMEQAVADVRAKLDAALGENAELRGRLEVATEEKEEQRLLRQEADRAAKSSDLERDRLQQSLDAARRDLAATEAQIGDERARLEDSREMVSTARADAAAAAAEMEMLRNSASAEAESLRGRAERAETETAAREEVARDLQQELYMTRSDLDRDRSEFESERKRLEKELRCAEEDLQEARAELRRLGDDMLRRQEAGTRARERAERAEGERDLLKQRQKQRDDKVKRRCAGFVCVWRRAVAAGCASEPRSGAGAGRLSRGRGRQGRCTGRRIRRTSRWAPRPAPSPGSAEAEARAACAAATSARQKAERALREAHAELEQARDALPRLREMAEQGMRDVTNERVDAAQREVLEAEGAADVERRRRVSAQQLQEDAVRRLGVSEAEKLEATREVQRLRAIVAGLFSRGSPQQPLSLSPRRLESPPRRPAPEGGLDVQFADPQSGNVLRFFVTSPPCGLEYAVNGEPRPATRCVHYEAATGLLRFMDTGRGAQLPVEGREVLVGQLRELASAAGAWHNFTQQLVSPPAPRARPAAYSLSPTPRGASQRARSAEHRPPIQHGAMLASPPISPLPSRSSGPLGGRSGVVDGGIAPPVASVAHTCDESTPASRLTDGAVRSGLVQ